ncbi:MAG: FtsX-like permease family protein [Geminicoccaceae bacterium]
MLRFVLADLRRQRLGVAAIVLLVALATMLGVTVTLQERAIRLGSARAAAAFDLVIGAPGSETQLVLSSVFLQPAPLPLLPAHLLAELRADPKVAWAAPVGFGDFAGGLPIVGTTEELIAGLGGVTQGRSFARLGEAVLGAAAPGAIGDQLHPLHGELHESDAAHAAVTYTVTGRLAATGTAWDRAVLVPIETVWRLHGLGHHHEDEAAGEDHDQDHDHDQEHDHDHDHDHEAHVDLQQPVDPAAVTGPEAAGLPAILVKPRSFAAAYKLRQAYRTAATMAVFPGEVLTRLYGMLGDARLVLALVASGAQALVMAAILLAMTLHVLQRRRQIGALRAFGAARRVVFAIVWLEAFVVIGLGLVLGYGLGFLASWLLAQRLAAANGIGLPVAFLAEDGWSAFALLALGALVATVPALLAYRHAPAEALRA